MRLFRRRWWLVPVVLLPVVALAGMVAWATVIPAPMDEALEALRTSSDVAVETEPWLVFRPSGPPPEVGLIFYPGARVDYRAYAPAARAIADAGYLVVVPPMPLNLAVLAPDRAKDIQAAFPEVNRWAVGGHSLGGAMAARFAAQNPELVQGLVLWGAYPPSSSSLRDASLEVVSVSGSQDGLATPDKIRASRDLLPAETRWVEIAGANHAQFGWYGSQSGDNDATVTRSVQQDQAVAATVALLRSLEEAP